MKLQLKLLLLVVAISFSWLTIVNIYQFRAVDESQVAGLSTYATETCQSHWQCTLWSGCNPTGTMDRTCTDNSHCDNPLHSPLAKQSCTSVYTDANTLRIIVGSITIVGDDKCVAATQRALSILSSKARVHFDNVTQYLGVIECSDLLEIHADEEPSRVTIDVPTRTSTLDWYASVLVHEACHAKQYRDRRFNSESILPLPGTNPAEAQCLDAQLDALTRMGSSTILTDFVKQERQSKYDRIEYQVKWWE